MRPSTGRYVRDVDREDNPLQFVLSILRWSLFTPFSKVTVEDKKRPREVYAPTLGFPPGDIANKSSLVDFFCGFKFKPALYVQRRYLLFLLKAISFANELIDLQIASGCGTELLAAKWWDHIGLSQSKERIVMYTTAIDVSLPLKGLENILDESIQFDTIQIQGLRVVISSEASGVDIVSKTVSQPAVMFYFDEAHHLTKTTVTAHIPRNTAYQCLCKALTYMTSTPVFAFFLSTYSQLSESTPRVRTFWSSRPQSNESQGGDDNMNVSFVELPFDTWKKQILVTKGSHSSKQICLLLVVFSWFWALLQNPKLANIRKMMAHAMRKLDLHLDDSTWDKLHDYPFKELIPALTYLHGGYPSEPFLAEAAARAIFKKCWIKASDAHRNIQWAETEDIVNKIIQIDKTDIPSAILALSERWLVDKGHRGKLVVRMLCTLAHDISILKNPSFTHDYQVVNDEVSFSKMIPVVDFLCALVSEEYIEIVLKARPKNVPGKTLEEAFQQVDIYR
ncbi:hypothetical protein C0993_002939 [Termitomyces sp. T159_Od127]|nr:hypothetical protein C0993_002939 [Termitomyces sp. T159_Od127]